MFVVSMNSAFTLTVFWTVGQTEDFWRRCLRFWKRSSALVCPSFPSVGLLVRFCSVVLFWCSSVCCFKTMSTFQNYFLNFNQKLKLCHVLVPYEHFQQNICANIQTSSTRIFLGDTVSIMDLIYSPEDGHLRMRHKTSPLYPDHQGECHSLCCQLSPCAYCKTKVLNQQMFRSL